VRRWAFAERDGLGVARRPDGGSVLGMYATGRRKGRAREKRPYATLLESLSPLVTSCDCPDFLRSSLGLCKHGLVVLDHVFRSRRRLARGVRQSAESSDRGPRIRWEPDLPLAGEIDRLVGLRLDMPTPGPLPVGSKTVADGHLTRALRAFFRAGP
jgi:hypothetical protein